MPAGMYILAVICAAVLTMAYMLCDRSTNEQPLKSAKVHHDSADSPSNLVKKIKNGELVTAPFNKSNLISPFLHYMAMMEVAPEYHMSACIIEKVMSTTIDSIFCYLTNSTEFTARGRTISTEKAISRMCWKQNRHLGYEGIESKVGLRRKQFVTVRHPLQRFLSGFAEKCTRCSVFLIRGCLRGMHVVEMAFSDGIYIILEGINADSEFAFLICGTFMDEEI